MIRKFFDNKIGSLTLVILVIMLIRIPIYFITQYQPTNTLNTGILSNFINEINSVRWLSFVLSFIVVIIEGLIVNKLFTTSLTRKVKFTRRGRKKERKKADTEKA